MSKWYSPVSSRTHTHTHTHTKNESLCRGEWSFFFLLRLQIARLFYYSYLTVTHVTSLVPVRTGATCRIGRRKVVTVPVTVSKSLG